MIKTLRLVAVLAALALVAAACGDDDDSASAEDLTLVSAGQLSVCTDSPYAPFEFQNDAGEFQGFDVELVQAMAAELGLEANFIVTPFDGIWLQPAAGTCDMVASAMTITDERAENAVFTDPYFDADQSLLVRSADSGLKLADMSGRVIAVQTGTTGEIYATENAPEGAELRSFDEPAAMFLALEGNDVDAILQDLPVNGERAAQEPDKFVLSDQFPTGEQYGFSVSLENTDLANALNDALSTVRDAGDYDTIFATWFGTTPE